METGSTEKFIQDFISPSKSDIVRRTKISNEFSIRHFEGNVVYSAVSLFLLYANLIYNNQESLINFGSLRILFNFTERFY